MVNWVSPCLSSFFSASTVAAYIFPAPTCKGTIISLENCELNGEFQHFIPRFNKISLLYGYPPGYIYTLQQDKYKCKKLGGVSVNDLHLHWIYMWYIWLLTLTCTTLAITQHKNLWEFLFLFFFPFFMMFRGCHGREKKKVKHFGKRDACMGLWNTHLLGTKKFILHGYLQKYINFISPRFSCLFKFFITFVSCFYDISSSWVTDIPQFPKCGAPTQLPPCPRNASHPWALPDT